VLAQRCRVAREVGLTARELRWRRETIDNLGGFRLIEPNDDYVVAGERFQMSAHDVIVLFTVA
jgi:hypothetical protein